MNQQNFNQLVAQQGIPQQGLPPQPPLDHHQQSVPGLINPEHVRAWQQMQQMQQNHIQSQMRQQGGGLQGGAQGNNPQQVRVVPTSPPFPQPHPPPFAT